MLLQASRLANSLAKAQSELREAENERSSLTQSQRNADLNASRYLYSGIEFFVMLILFRLIGKKDGEINGLNQAVDELKANLDLEKQKSHDLQAELSAIQSALSDALDKLKTQHQLIGELKSQLEAARSELDDERTQSDEARLKHSEETSSLKAQINMERKNGILNAADLERQISLLKAKLKRESEGSKMVPSGK